MPGSALAELLFIAGMMILILILCAVAVYAFFKTYRKEMKDRAAEQEAKRLKKMGQSETRS